MIPPTLRSTLFPYTTLFRSTTSFQTMIERSDIILSNDYALLILILIFIGAFTKSAQFPFHIWLPDAMEAPTPVSAYLHSATMVDRKSIRLNSSHVDISYAGFCLKKQEKFYTAQDNT